MSAVSVSSPKDVLTSSSTRPAHHRNDAGTLFTNPWASFRAPGLRQLFQALKSFARPPVPQGINELMRLRTPDWGVAANPDTLKATWLGHACFLVELPTPPGAARGPRVLFDPVFSERCSPSAWVGPIRLTPPPCTVSEIPEVDVVVYSHNHYDHLDLHTLSALISTSTATVPPPRQHIFAPLNNQAPFLAIGIPSTHIHCIDWWQTCLVSVELPPVAPLNSDSTPAPIRTSFRLTCTPCQHISNRGVLDRFTTLWASWAVESWGEMGVRDGADVDAAPARKTLWFAGDTGYRTVHAGEDEDKVPTCPVFHEIGEKFGGFDLALVPIGAYLPRAALSAVHCAPQDSVRLFQDVKARKAVAMHWGTWRLSFEPIMEPAQRLAEECAKAGVPKGVFDVCGIGETVVV